MCYCYKMKSFLPTVCITIFFLSCYFQVHLEYNIYENLIGNSATYLHIASSWQNCYSFRVIMKKSKQKTQLKTILQATKLY